MESCKYTSRVGVYLDDELTPEQRQMMAAHIEQCAECGAELESLRGMSQLFSGPDSQDLTPRELARLRSVVCAAGAPEEAPLRLFGALLAIAASIVVVCGAWMYEAPRPTPRAPYAAHEMPAWERVATNLRVDPDPFFGQEGTAAIDPNLAEWMMSGLSDRENRRDPTQN